MADIVNNGGTFTEEFCTEISESTIGDIYSEKREIMT